MTKRIIAEKVSKKKNKFGRIVNLCFLLLYISAIIGTIILNEAWYHS